MRNEFDRIVIGGGAAGLFAAGWAAKSGLRVLVLEKRERPARKILVTGKGRCNVTNHCSPQEFIAAVRRNPRFLMSAIYAMTPQDTMACFEELGVTLKTERGRRVFPVSDKASDIQFAFDRAIKERGIEVRYNSPVRAVEASENRFAVTTSHEKVEAKTEKDCPYCHTTIPIEASRCPHCTSQLADVLDEG